MEDFVEATLGAVHIARAAKNVAETGTFLLEQNNQNKDYG